MIHKSSIVSCLLVAGLGATLAACGNTETPPPAEDTYSTTIEKDLISGGCAASAACHNAQSTTKLKIDTATGKTQANYDAMIAAAVIVKGAGDTSPLVVVPKTLKNGANTHPQVGVTMTTIARWATWITAGAKF